VTDSTRNKSLLKALFGIAAALAAILIGRKVVKEAKKRRAQEEY
jgi:hypothetical protein